MIGSLFWEETPLRTYWRDTFLDMTKKRRVSLPIRYGRLSRNRAGTHTMIFSSECKSSERCGTGYFIPFQHPMTLSQLELYGRHMTDAENNRPLKQVHFDWNWGCLAMATHPQLAQRRPAAYQRLREFWRERFSPSFSPERYRIGEEVPAVSSGGILNTDWPEALSEVEIAIGTANIPNLERYPAAGEIAAKMREKHYETYFRETYRAGITTFQDKAIVQALEG